MAGKTASRLNTRVPTARGAGFMLRLCEAGPGGSTKFPAEQEEPVFEQEEAEIAEEKYWLGTSAISASSCLNSGRFPFVAPPPCCVGSRDASAIRKSIRFDRNNYCQRH